MLFGFGPESLVSQLGFRSGDKILRVNGVSKESVSSMSPTQLEAIVTEMRQAKQLTVDLRRDGEPIQLSYSMVGRSPEPDPQPTTRQPSPRTRR